MLIGFSRRSCSVPIGASTKILFWAGFLAGGCGKPCSARCRKSGDLQNLANSIGANNPVPCLHVWTLTSILLNPLWPIQSA